MSTITVELTRSEMAMGAECGAARNVIAMFDDKHPAYGMPKARAWRDHIEGACGEIAAAKVLGRYWNRRINTFKGADIGDNIQVRTRSEHGYELYIRPKETFEHYWVLVTGTAPRFVVRGYILGTNAKRDEWIRDYGERPNAYFVPTGELLDIEDLKCRVGG